MGLFNERLRSLDISLGIGETSRVTGATPTQIRYWEKKHLIHSLRHEANGNKRYSLSNIALIVMIKSMLDEGYTLAKASEEIEKSHQKADMLHVLMSTRLQVHGGRTGTSDHFQAKTILESNAKFACSRGSFFYPVIKRIADFYHFANSDSFIKDSSFLISFLSRFF